MNKEAELEIQNGLASHFCHETLKLQYHRGTEDVIVRKRKKLDHTQELFIDIVKTMKVRQMFNLDTK